MLTKKERTMQRFILSLALFLLAAACAAQEHEEPLSGDNQREATDLPNPDDLKDEDTENTCGKGGPPSFIKYGAGYIEVKPSHSVSRKFEWRIMLQPKLGYAGALVIIKGKDASGAWIDKIAQASVDSEFFICVPDGIALGDYFYSVEIVGVGTIDPRVIVTD
jgi:hypothetical protein